MQLQTCGTMPNHTVQYWSEWVVRHNDALPYREGATTIGIGARPNGVQITFPSGITASIQWTKGNSCSRRSCASGAHLAESLQRIDPHDPSGSPDAELAFWDSEGVWYHFGSDTVIGYQTVEETSQWLMRADGSTRFLPLETDIVRCEDCYLFCLKTTMLRDGDLWYCDDCAPSDLKVGAEVAKLQVRIKELEYQLSERDNEMRYLRKSLTHSECQREEQDLEVSEREP